jgi:outer membrane protein TolC
MDEALARTRLAKAEAAVSQETTEIEKQRAVIQRLQNEGHETERAERLLKTLEHSLAALKHHRDIMLEHLGLYEAGEGGTNAAGLSFDPASRPKS